MIDDWIWLMISQRLLELRLLLFCVSPCSADDLARRWGRLQRKRAGALLMFRPQHPIG